MTLFCYYIALSIRRINLAESIITMSILPIIPSLYEIKKALLYPRTLYMRNKEKVLTGFIKTALELHYYRPSFYDFIAATVVNKNILHEANLDENSVVIDVGAFTGEWTQHIVERYNPTIYAFEPDPINYKQLQEKAATNSKLIPLFYGIGDTNEKVKISLKGLGSSIFKEADKTDNIKTAITEIKSIECVWQELELTTVDLMKINIEGAEFPLLEKMIEEDLLKNVDSFMIQFHEWHPRAYSRRKRILKELSKTHKMVWDYNFVWEKWDRI
jgi:FkbM family methyltransferase